MSAIRKVFGICVFLFALAGQASADDLATFKAAINASNSGSNVTAVRLFKPLAEKGLAAAQYLLGLEYYHGSEGVPKNYKESMKWFRLAAEQGDADAQNTLGGMYERGNGVQKDFKEAAKWYRLAAAQGKVLAQYSLGLMYREGKGVAENSVLAYMWADVAASYDGDKIMQALYIITRDNIAKRMTAHQKAEAQKLSIKCAANKFKGCEQQ